MSAFSRVTIEFKNSIPEEFKNEKLLIKTLKDFHSKGRCDINITDLFYSDSGERVEFEMYSDRVINLEFQVNLVYDYLKTHFIPVYEMNASAYTNIDSGSCYYTEEDFDN